MIPQRLLEGGAGFAAGAIGAQGGEEGEHIFLPHFAQHCRHHEIAGGEAVFEEVARAEPGPRAKSGTQLNELNFRIPFSPSATGSKSGVSVSSGLADIL